MRPSVFCLSLCYLILIIFFISSYFDTDIQKQVLHQSITCWHKRHSTWLHTVEPKAVPLLVWKALSDRFRISGQKNKTRVLIEMEYAPLFLSLVGTIIARSPFSHVAGVKWVVSSKNTQIGHSMKTVNLRQQQLAVVEKRPFLPWIEATALSEMNSIKSRKFYLRTPKQRGRVTATEHQSLSRSQQGKPRNSCSTLSFHRPEDKPVLLSFFPPAQHSHNAPLCPPVCVCVCYAAVC